jgi:flagellar motor switch protein FliN
VSATDAVRAAAAAATEALAALAGEPVADAELGQGPLETAGSGAVVATAGENLFVMPAAVARRLAETEASELGELELGAVATALQPVMDAVARALAVEPVEVRATDDLPALPPDATRAAVSLFGEPCELVLVASAEVPADAVAAAPDADADAADAARVVRDALCEVPLRVWAELGRARLQTADVAALGDGSIVDLDHAADDPVDIYVNGSRIGTGRLIRIEESDWAVRLEEVYAVAEPGDPLE